MASPPITEIVTLHISPKFTSEHEIWEGLLDIVKTKKGIQKIWYGITVEDEKLAFCFLDWDAFECHGDVMKEPNYAEFVQKFQAVLTAPMEMIHVPTTPFPPTSALQGPIVEYITFDLKPEVDLNVFKEAVIGMYDAATNYPGCGGGAWGMLRESALKAVLILSWSSIEAHLEGFQKSDVFKAAVAPLGACVTEFKLYHIKITSFRD